MLKEDRVGRNNKWVGFQNITREPFADPIGKYVFNSSVRLLRYELVACKEFLDGRKIYVAITDLCS
jgi:hypothetical protein